MYCMIHNQNPVYIVNSNLFRLIHVLFRHISHIVAYLEPCATLEYSELCQIQNPDIFTTQDVFKTLSKHTFGYSER